ncbi:hypothetical protein GQ457_06G019860 [Hibiscus cannabinus]
MYHGGCFVEDHVFRYTGKFVDHHEWCRIEGMNMLELADMVFILGYRCPVKLYWKKAEDNLTRESIRQLNTDQDVLSLVDNMPRNHYLNVYVVEESIKYGPDLVQNDLNDKPEVGSGSGQGQDDMNDQPEVGLGLGQDDLDDEPEIELGMGEDDLNDELNLESDNGSDSDSVFVDCVDSGSSSNESDSVFVESDNDVGEEETCTENVANEVDKEYCGIGLFDLGVGSRVGSDSESQNSESLHSVHESDSDGEKFPEFNMKDVYKDHGAVVSLTKCQRARDYALEKIMGSQKQQYGYYGGHILAAVGIDVDDCIYPIAYACVESECGQSWAWFLDILKDDLDIVNSYHISFMSDRQKGLVDAIAELFPHSKHRTCVRHLYTNFKSEDFNKGKHLKDLFWKAARSTIVTDFKDTLEEIKSVSSKSYDWLVKINPEQWCKAFFTSATKSDMLLNNLCECFNKFVLEARDKPILTMMETIRTKIMQRIAKKQSQAEKCVGPLCPKIQKKLEIMSELSNRNAGGQQYQVECGYGNQHVVNMQALTCTCRRWELTGIPCNHAVSVMILTEVRPESHVHECYTKTTQERIYSNFINPIRGPNQWTPQEGCVPILPPPLRRPPGRPHKSRRKEADEPASTSTKLSRKYVKLKCTKCGKPGHNIRTCKGEVRTTKKQVPSGQTPTEQSQTTIQPPRTTLLKEPCQPRQKQPIKRKEPIALLQPKTHIEAMLQTLGWTILSRFPISGSHHRKKLQLRPAPYLEQPKNLLPGLALLHDVLRSASSPQLHFGISLLESIFRISFLIFL